MGCVPQRFSHYQPGSKAALFSVTVVCAVIIYGLMNIALLNDSAVQVRKTAIQYKEKQSIHAPGPWVPQEKWVKFPGRMWQGYQLPVLTAQPLGRTGNVMGEYATLWALKHIYNATVLVTPRMKYKLSCFPSLSLPDCPGKKLERPPPHFTALSMTRKNNSEKSEGVVILHMDLVSVSTLSNDLMQLI
ncbi:uncharacterized protein LOC134773904 [Penaeus indicus]|uniref:uncharacterized protein LOC134773904 n=1 Tax=Penaeus indicus TaxID=29960 RepID=UPI00300D1D00